MNRTTRPIRSRAARRGGFSLAELVIVITLSTCLVGWYVRALEEADAFDEMLQNDSMVRESHDARERRAVVMRAALEGERPEAHLAAGQRSAASIAVTGGLPDERDSMTAAADSNKKP